MATPSNPALTPTATTVTPEPAGTSPLADVSSPAEREGIWERQRRHTQDDTHSFARQLDYPDDDEDNDGLLFMASCTQVELDAPYDPNKHLLTPGQGSQKTDPAYTNRLQNPDSYSPTLTSKAFAMINSKVEWNGKCSSFDELKGLIEGHFKGNGASHFVHHCFLDKYEVLGYKVLHFFPCVSNPKNLRNKCDFVWESQANLSQRSSQDSHLEIRTETGWHPHLA
jgi:hypothetical protein